MELNQWPALVVGFFGCLPGFSGGISVVGFVCGVESVAGFGGGFFSVFARSIWWWVSVLARSVWW